MASPTALPLIQYHASLTAPAWGPHAEPLELEGSFLRVRHIDVREELGQPWRMVLEVASNHPHFDPSRMVGADVSLHMLREDAANPAENDGRFFHGVVLSNEYIGAFSEAYQTRLLVGPALGLLGSGRRSRVFQDCSVVEIAQQVAEELLSSRGGELDVTRLVREYPLRDYCVQYGETDLAFLQRVLAEEGISFAFEADDSHERTVLLDDHDRFGSVLRMVEGLEGTPPPQHVPVRGDRGELADEETIASFTWRQHTHPGHGELEQWDWKQASPGHLQAKIEPEEVAPYHAGAFYEHGGRRLQEDAGGDGPHLDDTSDRLGRKHALYALDANTFDGTSNVMSMSPGSTFELDGHPDTELNGPYYCLRVTHTADNADVELGATDGSNYDNRFLCASLEQAFAPATLARPRIFGVQTATVVGPAGEEIHTDEYGRVKVRLHWDREQRPQDDDTSCWLRVAHSWAGAGFGTQFIPRIGMEVLVSFLGGDPDRPVCVGAVYNGGNALPYDLPDNKTQSGIKTQSSPGGDGFNELRFEDAAGKEEVYFHAQKDHRERVNNVHSQSVGATQSVSVGSTQTVNVGGKRLVNVTGDQMVTVGAPPPEDGEPAAGPSSHWLTAEGDITVTSVQQEIMVTAPTKISLVCGGSSIVLEPGGIVVTSGGGASMGLSDKVKTATAAGPDKAGGVQIEMLPTGEMTTTSSKGASIALNEEIDITSGHGSRAVISEKVMVAAVSNGRLELDSDARLAGGTTTLDGSIATLTVSQGIDGNGKEVLLKAGNAALELAAFGAKLSGTTVDVAGTGAVSVGAPNVKIN